MPVWTLRSGGAGGHCGRAVRGRARRAGARRCRAPAAGDLAHRVERRLELRLVPAPLLRVGRVSVWRDSGSGFERGVPLELGELGEPVDLRLRIGDQAVVARARDHAIRVEPVEVGEEDAVAVAHCAATISAQARPTRLRHSGVSSSDHGGPPSRAGRG